MGGGELAHALFEADLIDQMGVNIQPLLLGDGIPLFHPLPRRAQLELLQSRVLRSGSVYLLYKVLH
jgi:dihydrofolate reductase